MAPNSNNKFKPERVPAHASSEPSEPSEVRPEDKSKEQLQGVQGENPQVVAHKTGRQAGDSKEWQKREGRGAGNVGAYLGGGEGGDSDEKLEGPEGTLDRVARDGFAGGGKRDRSTVKSKL